MRRRCERDDRGGSRFTLRRVCRLSSSRRLRSNLRRTAFHDKKKERRARRENASSRPRHLTMHAKKYQNTESARELRGVRGFGCDADSRHALVHAHRAFFEDVSLGRRADGGGSRRETVYFCAAFSAHHRLRDRETARCVLTESRGIASARVATSGGCLAASSGRHASGRPGSRPLGRAGAAARPPHARPRKPVLELGADETVRRTVRGERRSCRSPRPRPRAPCPRRTRTRRCPRRRRETPRPRRPRTPEGS